MEELTLKCKVAPRDTLYVSQDVTGEIAFETMSDNIVVLTYDDVRRLIVWLQERLDK
ncbi:hypothetical protein UFOVP810_17 [uncultured Caudovirales phage]|uniref:Uncharacterized protein n=1 Tax=uncultured Caudovirales phage TaxID=2100421 RepID=A0A6J5NUI2_9CAUD|nr:hypothetical protein UFOVP810_17 [uncultured Caudovirales phage]